MLQYTTVGLLYTRTCPLACRHCIIESSPKAEGKMRQDTAAEYLRTITAYSKEVCFTGGEPLLYYTEVVELIRFAVSLGLETSVVSGAGWVRVDKTEIARERVRGLKEAGLKKLCISWDQYHEEFSPRAQAELLASLAQEFEIEVVVRGVVPANRRDARPKTVFGGVAAEFQSLIQLGTARTLPEEQFLKLDEPPRGACSTVLTPSIEPDGNVYACCGPARFGKTGSPLLLGNTGEESLGAILERGRRDPILKAISLVGPFGLYQLLKKTDRYEEVFQRRRHYNNMCDLCLDMTDLPDVVTRLRARLSDADGRAMLMAAEMLQRKKAAQEQFVAPDVTDTRSEVPHVA
jgi:hypothetical protein